MIDEEEALWFGLFEVRPEQGNSILDSSEIGAYVNIFSIAENEDDFISKSSTELSSFLFTVTSYEDVNIISDIYSLNDIFYELAKKALNSKEIVLGNFHTYQNEN